jgi:hypothetical protein
VYGPDRFLALVAGRRVICAGRGDTVRNMGKTSRSKAKSRSTAGRRSAPRQGGAGTGDPGLDAIIVEVVRLARVEVRTIATGAEAEAWGSHLASLWTRGLSIGGPDPMELVGGGVVQALLRAGDQAAFAALCALASVADGPVGEAAGLAVRRLGERGTKAPAWKDELGSARPVQARLLREDVFDDGVSVLVEFELADGTLETLGVYVDHNLSGSAKGIFVGGSLREVADVLASAPDDGVEVRLDALSLEEAAARIREGLELTDMTLEAPVSEDYWELRALAGARLRSLPQGVGLPEREEVEPEQRQRLLEEFLASPEGSRFRGSVYEEDVAAFAIDFGADYLDGRPLRWSPVVVELFMTDWLPRKVAHDQEFFAAVPHVLREWVRFAGRTRGIPTHAIELTVGSVTEWAEELVEAAADPAGWGPAKMLASAMREAGVDAQDEQAVQAFIDELNARPAGLRHP